MPIRKRVLYAFIERYPNQAKGILEQALLDRSRSIRHLSRYYLKQLGISEFSNRAMQLTTPTTICSIRRHECLPQKCGRTYGSFSN